MKIFLFFLNSTQGFKNKSLRFVCLFVLNQSKSYRSFPSIELIKPRRLSSFNLKLIDTLMILTNSWRLVKNCSPHEKFSHFWLMVKVLITFGKFWMFFLFKGNFHSPTTDRENSICLHHLTKRSFLFGFDREVTFYWKIENKKNLTLVDKFRSRKKLGKRGKKWQNDALRNWKIQVFKIDIDCDEFWKNT